MTATETQIDDLFGASEEVSESTTSYLRADRTARSIPTIGIRGGKQVYGYRDVLNEAHRLGLRQFRQNHDPIVKFDNGGQIVAAVCSVTAVFDDGSEWQGVGDATVNNVAMAKEHLVRMADTRAKARALGDALNLDANFGEEFGGDDEHDSAPSSNAPRPTSRSKSNAPRQRSQTGSDESIEPYIEQIREAFPSGPPYHCESPGCTKTLVDSGDGSGTRGNASAEWKAAKSLQQTGRVLCWDHQKEA